MWQRKRNQFHFDCDIDGYDDDAATNDDSYDDADDDDD